MKSALCYVQSSVAHSSVAQLVEQVAVNHLVAGSSPAVGANYQPPIEAAFSLRSDLMLVESRLGGINHLVAGSSPAVGAKDRPNKGGLFYAALSDSSDPVSRPHATLSEQR